MIPLNVACGCARKTHRPGLIKYASRARDNQPVPDTTIILDVRIIGKILVRAANTKCTEAKRQLTRVVAKPGIIDRTAGNRIHRTAELAKVNRILVAITLLERGLLHLLDEPGHHTIMVTRVTLPILHLVNNLGHRIVKRRHELVSAVIEGLERVAHIRYKRRAGSTGFFSAGERTHQSFAVIRGSALCDDIGIGNLGINMVDSRFPCVELSAKLRKLGLGTHVSNGIAKVLYRDFPHVLFQLATGSLAITPPFVPGRRIRLHRLLELVIVIGDFQAHAALVIEPGHVFQCLLQPVIAAHRLSVLRRGLGEPFAAMLANPVKPEDAKRTPVHLDIPHPAKILRLLQSFRVHHEQVSGYVVDRDTRYRDRRRNWAFLAVNLECNRNCVCLVVGGLDSLPIDQRVRLPPILGKVGLHYPARDKRISQVTRRHIDVRLAEVDMDNLVAGRTHREGPYSSYYDTLDILHHIVGHPFIQGNFAFFVLDGSKRLQRDATKVQLDLRGCLHRLVELFVVVKLWHAPSLYSEKRPGKPRGAISNAEPTK